MNETLYRWTFKFHKVVRQHNSGAVDDFILPYSAVYLRIQKWKNYWNRSTFAKVIVKIKVAQFFLTHSVDICYAADCNTTCEFQYCGGYLSNDVYYSPCIHSATRIVLFLRSIHLFIRQWCPIIYRDWVWRLGLMITRRFRYCICRARCLHWVMWLSYLIRYWRDSVVCLSVRPSACLWRSALWLNDNPTTKLYEQVNKKCPLGTRLYNI